MSRAFDHTTYLSPFSWRYGSHEMRAVWSEEHNRKLWRRLWVALAEAQQRLGLVSQAQVDDLKRHAEEIDIARRQIAAFDEAMGKVLKRLVEWTIGAGTIGFRRS